MIILITCLTTYPPFEFYYSLSLIAFLRNRHIAARDLAEGLDDRRIRLSSLWNHGRVAL